MKLKHKFYRRDTTTVARELLGKRLVHVIKDKSGSPKRLSGIIVEVEAYLGIRDRGCHTFGDRCTPRTKTMYLPGGHAYVYLIYGMHYCINAVTMNEGEPEAVLLRALEPSENIELMKQNRNLNGHSPNLTNGPGKLCQALQITKKQDAMDLTGKELFIEDTGLKVPSKNIIAGPRVGIDYAQEAMDWPLRFSINGNPYVSRAK
jgi:DNA-3-methyladenine glycosylase